MKKLQHNDKKIIELTPTGDWLLPYRKLVKHADVAKRATVGPDLLTKCKGIYNHITMNIECSR